ncbi:MAG: cobalamin-binding protein [bacterium]|nr:cobalamin-binding protein [bacterium]
MEILAQIAEELELGDDERVPELTQQALEQKIPALEILDNGLLKGMNSIGKKFKNHDVFLPDVLLAAKAMHAGMALIKPLLAEDDVPARGKIILGTVKGDLHDIGKNLVGIMLKGAGYEVVDLGYDVSAETFLEATRQHDCSVIGMSALLTTTMPMMKQVVELVRKENPENQIKIIIGGAPVTQAYADEIGADAYAYDAASAVRCVEELTAA